MMSVYPVILDFSPTILVYYSVSDISYLKYHNILHSLQTILMTLEIIIFKNENTDRREYCSFFFTGALMV